MDHKGAVLMQPFFCHPDRSEAQWRDLLFKHLDISSIGARMNLSKFKKLVCEICAFLNNRSLHCARFCSLRSG